jgi:hypothetical protein
MRIERRRTSSLLLTHTTVDHIKSIPAVQRILRDHQCFLTEHQWTEEVWDTNQLGFVTGIDPNFYTASQAQVKFNTDLRKRAEVTIHNPKRIKFPQFRIAEPKQKQDQKSVLRPTHWKSVTATLSL